MIILGGEEGLECELVIGLDWSMSQNLNTWDVFWTNQVDVRQSVV